MRIGVLTGGGDCPGLNAVIRGIVRKAETVYGDEIIGFLDAWDGIREQRYVSLDIRSMRGTLPKGGTVLGTRRGSPFDWPEGPDHVNTVLAELDIDSLIVIGGNGSLTVSTLLGEQCGTKIVGVPKTIDNDVYGTDVTFGFHTAVQIATDAIDRLHTTAESHDRVLLVEVMGRDAGWIAVYAGIAGGATNILIPEHPFDLDEVCSVIQARHERGRYASIIVVAEGAMPKEGTLAMPEKELDQFGHVKYAGIAQMIAPEIQSRTGYETRVVQIGHVQRGGTPTAFDRVLATRFGLAAIDAVHERAFGQMVVARGTEIELAPLALAGARTRTVDPSLYETAAVFFG